MNGNIPEDDWLGKVEGLSDDKAEQSDSEQHGIRLPRFGKSADKTAKEISDKAPTPDRETLKPITPKSKSGVLVNRIDKSGVRSDITDMTVALLPLVAWGAYLYGARVITLSLISVISGVLFDALTPILLKKPVTASDLSGVVIGLITVLLMPASAPLWFPILGNFIAVVIIKHFAGGLTRIKLHPSASAAAVLYILFPRIMCAIPEIKAELPILSVGSGVSDGITLPLERLMSGYFPTQTDWDLFFGMCPGMIGEVSAFLIIGGAIWLAARKVTDLRQPIAFILTLGILSYIFPRLAIASDLLSIRYAIDCVFSGSAVFCAFLMTSYPGPSPISARARLASGVIGGALLFGLRCVSVSPADAVPVILVMNLLATPLDILLRPSVLGGIQKEKTALTRSE